ncbi:hypothetical protein [Streptomyces sp. ATCC 21386]|uniref:hypothetical protein n=1 Tax=Streptomyces sp. ATCC 21386 TaxID=2699428 RepID=UPI001BFF0379|nr:hypothetical protein [Streptomyces sp. ATCC 21386]
MSPPSIALPLRILATSLQTLCIVGEYVCDVPALSLNEAVDLLATRAAAVQGRQPHLLPEGRISARAG